MNLKWSCWITSFEAKSDPEWKGGANCGPACHLVQTKLSSAQIQLQRDLCNETHWSAHYHHQLLLYRKVGGLLWFTVNGNYFWKRYFHIFPEVITLRVRDLLTLCLVSYLIMLRLDTTQDAKRSKHNWQPGILIFETRWYLDYLPFILFLINGKLKRLRLGERLLWS